MATDPNALMAAPAVQGRSVDPGNGWTWIVGSWGLFKRQPLLWVVLAVILFVILIVLAFIPVIGQLAIALLIPVFGAGIMLGCKAVDGGGQLEIGHLFAGFKGQVQPLIVLGVLNLVASVVIGFITLLIGGGSLAAVSMAGSDLGALIAALMGAMLAVLVALALSVPLAMAMWFAVPLILFRNLGAVDAVKASFWGCLKNIIPFLVYGVVMLVLGFIASIPAGLGWLVLWPVIWASIYVSYKDIYG